MNECLFTLHQVQGYIATLYLVEYQERVLLLDGQVLPDFPDWRAYAAPGHTLYDMVFYHAEEKLLYVGDLVIKFGEKIVLPFPTLFPELMTATLKQMARLPVKKILLAHGGVIEITDGYSFFTELLPLVGKHGQAVFKMMEPLCSLAPDVQIYKKSR